MSMQYALIPDDVVDGFRKCVNYGLLPKPRGGAFDAMPDWSGGQKFKSGWPEAQAKLEGKAPPTEDDREAGDRRRVVHDALSRLARGMSRDGWAELQSALCRSSEGEDEDGTDEALRESAVRRPPGPQAIDRRRRGYAQDSSDRRAFLKM